MIVVVPPASAARLADSKLSSVTNSPSGTATWQCGSTPPGITSSPVGVEHLGAVDLSRRVEHPGDPAARHRDGGRAAPGVGDHGAAADHQVGSCCGHVSLRCRSCAAAAEGAAAATVVRIRVVVGARAEQQRRAAPGPCTGPATRPGSGHPAPARSRSRRTRRRCRSAPRRRRCARPAPPGSGSASSTSRSLSQPGTCPPPVPATTSPGAGRHSGQPPAVVVERDRDQRRPHHRGVRAAAPRRSAGTGRSRSRGSPRRSSRAARHPATGTRRATTCAPCARSRAEWISSLRHDQAAEPARVRAGRGAHRVQQVAGAVRAGQRRRAASRR